MKTDTASGSDVDTGTATDKVVTPKAIADSDLLTERDIKTDFINKQTTKPASAFQTNYLNNEVEKLKHTQVKPQHEATPFIYNRDVLSTLGGPLSKYGVNPYTLYVQYHPAQAYV